eukprot:EG_transcript_11254
MPPAARARSARAARSDWTQLGAEQLGQETRDLPSEWCALHCDFQWTTKTESAESLERAHFHAIFGQRFPMRHAGDPASLPIGAATSTAKAALQRGVEVRLWCLMLKHARILVRTRNHLIALCQENRRRRATLLEAWKQYWTDCEDRRQQRLRHKLHAEPPQYARHPSRHALPRAMAVTPEAMKEKVLWELYWILKAQYGHETAEYWNRLFDVRHEYQQLREKGIGTARKLAEFFIVATQAPSFHFEMGADVVFKDLINFAGSHDHRFVAAMGGELAGDTPEAGQPMAACSCPAHNTYATFLRHPLCRHPDWLQARHANCLPLVPPLPCAIPRSITLTELPSLRPSGGGPLPSRPSFFKKPLGAKSPRDCPSPRPAFPSSPTFPTSVTFCGSPTISASPTFSVLSPSARSSLASAGPLPSHPIVFPSRSLDQLPKLKRHNTLNAFSPRHTARGS